MKIVSWLFLLITIGCKNKESRLPPPVNDSVTANSKKEPGYIHLVQEGNPVLDKKILDAFSRVPEIIEANHYIDSISGHKDQIRCMWEEPDSTHADYVVQLGYDGSERFETYYWLYVNPVTLKVRFYDVITDSVYNAEDYRKLGREKFY